MGVIWETVVKLLKVTKNKMMQLSLKKKKASHHLWDGINNQNSRQQDILTDSFLSTFETKTHVENWFPSDSVL